MYSNTILFYIFVPIFLSWKANDLNNSNYIFLLLEIEANKLL